MSALARVLLREGIPVSGSDGQDSAILRRLSDAGAGVFVGHSASQVPPDAVVVVSDAIKGDNPELAVARSRGQEVMRRSELLGRLMERHDAIAVSGTHGKTTTTAMLGHILLEAGEDPTIIVGGHVRELDGNARVGHGRLFVAEACEAYDALLDTRPRVAVITNIEADHLDHHGTIEHIVESFRQFVRQIVPGGSLVYNADDERAAVAAESCERRRVTFGIRNGDWRPEDPACTGMSSVFGVERHGVHVARVELPLPGKHYVLDALAAMAAAAEVGVSPEAAARALGTFEPVGRRFEKLGEADGVSVYDDYAHHPTEVRLTLEAARQAFPGKLVAVFQPHLYSRTRDHMREFIAAFDAADEAYIAPIYGSREEPIPGVDAAQLVDGIKRRSPDKPCRLCDMDALPDLVRARTVPGDVVFVMGAGDIRRVAEQLVAGRTPQAPEQPARM